MPMIIEHIDAIARQKQRDVLFVTFHEYFDEQEQEWTEVEDYDYDTDPKRAAFCEWVDTQQIAWQLCGEFASEYGFRSYLGQIYLDVLFDEQDEIYQKVREKLENPDGTMRDKQVRFRYVPLSAAMKNAHHDEPGFWERWAENF